MKHTPGPWSAGKERQEQLPGNQLRRFIPIYEIDNPHPPWASDDPEQNFPIVAGIHICDEASANARLIEAAPEMLVELKNTLNVTWNVEEALMDRIRALVQRIEGES